MKQVDRIWILQSALDYVLYGQLPEEPFQNEEERSQFETVVKDLKEYLERVGPEQFARTTFDVGDEDLYDEEDED
ncbi:MAG: hypothetical protein K6A68_06380 [Clostridiales bacterium]|nr:hypothetical protein [Clostridiales bacterium]